MSPSTWHTVSTVCVATINIIPASEVPPFPSGSGTAFRCGQDTPPDKGKRLPGPMAPQATILVQFFLSLPNLKSVFYARYPESRLTTTLHARRGQPLPFPHPSGARSRRSATHLITKATVCFHPPSSEALHSTGPSGLLWLLLDPSVADLLAPLFNPLSLHKLALEGQSPSQQNLLSSIKMSPELHSARIDLTSTKLLSHRQLCRSRWKVNVCEKQCVIAWIGTSTKWLNFS